jgi:hypothetical protein
MKTFGNVLALIAGGLSVATMFTPSASTVGWAMLITASVMWLVSLGIFMYRATRGQA